MQETIKGVKVRILDLIPQESPNGSFIMGAWNWASGIECVVEGRHEHVNCWTAFVVERKGGCIEQGMPVSV